MIKLLKLEFIKLFSYKTFIVLIILYCVLLTLSLVGTNGFLSSIGTSINSSIVKEAPNHHSVNPKTNAKLSKDVNLTQLPISNKFDIFKFPDVWHNISYIASWFSFLLAFIVIINISNEYSFKTIRSNIMNGLSRLDFIFSKLMFVLLLSIASSIFVFLLCLIFGLISSSSYGSIFENSGFIFGYFIQVITYLSFALFIGVLVKKSGFAIVLLLLYSIIIEPLAAGLLRNSIGHYLPLSNLNSLIDFPFLKYFTISWGADIFEFNINIIICVFYCLIFMGTTFLVIKKSDL